MLTVYIRYQIDPYKINEFESYAKKWLPLVEKFGGDHHGYFLPHESANDIAVALFSFPSMADYESYRKKSAHDEECIRAYKIATDTQCIIRYDRHFLRPMQHPDH